MIVIFRRRYLNGAQLIFAAAITLTLLLITTPPLFCQSSAGNAAKSAVTAVTGGGNGEQSNQEVVYPYKDKKTPESVKGWGKYILNFPLYQTGGHWIRLHQLILALVLLITGLWLSSLAGRMVKGWLVRFKRMPGHIAIAISKGLVYLLAFLVVIATVLSAGMPFTVVSILGAVLLLGASLGAKSTIYDYLSGLILAIEQPVRIGDCIEVSDHAGFVEEIRGRHTRVRRFDGIDVLVPNSMFLEQEVVNWTLNDSQLRGDILVGVDYESDVDTTIDVLMSCMNEMDDVLTTPEPSVLFWDFGESSLVFKLFFWLEVDNPLEKWTEESELRRIVFRRLQEAGITIAFPQRDLHLASKKPIQVELAEGTGEAGIGETTSVEKAKPEGRDNTTEDKKRQSKIAKPASDTRKSSSDGGSQGDEGEGK